MNSPERIAAQIHAAHSDLPRAQILDSVADAVLEARGAGEEAGAIGRRLEEWSAAFPGRNDLDSAATAVADLRLSLLAPDPPRPPGIGGVLSSISSWLFAHYPAVAGLSLAAAGVLYGLSYALFYADLDTSPARVGLTISQIVGASVSDGLALTAMMLACLFVAFLPFVVLDEEPEPNHPRQSWPWALLYLALILPSLAGFWALSRAFRSPGTTIGLIISGTLIWIAVGFLGVMTENPVGWRLPPLTFKRDRVGALLIALLPVALVGAGIATVVESAHLGNEAQMGRAVDSPRLLGVPFIGLRAEPATVRWLRRGSSTPLPRCILYLGNADGQAVLYAARTESTIRLPGNAVELRVGGGPSGCPQ